MSTKKHTPFLKTFGLQKVIYKSFLSSALVPLFFIEALLLIMYFGINQYISTEHKNTLYSETMASLEQIIDREVANLNLTLKEVSQLTKLLQLDHQQLFPLGESCTQPNGKTVFGVHKNGAYYKLKDNGGGSLYYAKGTEMGAQQKVKARCSESLDPLLKNIVKTNEIITQAYINTWDNMNRIYPFINDAPTQYGSQLNMRDYNFYYLANQEYNPERKTVWTKAYLDPAGAGWMASAVVPIYYNNTLEAVAGVDVTISTFVADVLNIKLPWPSSSFIVDSDGGILAMTKQIEQLLDLKELTAQDIEVQSQETTHKPQEYNLLDTNNQKIKEIEKMILATTGGTYEIRLNQEDYILKVGVIPETGWRMLTLVNSNVFLGPIVKLKGISNIIGYIAIAVILIFYAIFFIYLIKKSQLLAYKIATPIEQLTAHTTNLGKTFDLGQLLPVGIDEIDQLTTNFNTLNIELNKRSKDLVQGKVREQILNKEREHLENLAKFDNLTSLFNRHELNRVLEKVTKEIRRFQRGAAVLLIDIDNFNSINDNYSYQVGDHLLIRLAALLKKGASSSSVVGRWSGDQFLIIYPELNEEKIFSLATNICNHIASHRFEDVEKITVSIGGSSHWQSDSSVTSMIRNANIALSKAKREGKNAVAVFEPVIS